jgi:predicted TIM-barrel fold metal-dependent hydrolase
VSALAGAEETWPDHPAEQAIEPELPIIDPHHHIRDHVGDNRYLLPEFLEDLATGHNIIATVAIEEFAMYRDDGPREFAPVGETEFLNGIAAMFASGRYGPIRGCAGIVGAADLMLGDRVQEVLEAHIAAGGGHFRGIRARCAWHEAYAPARWQKNFFKALPHMLADPVFRRGVARLAANDLSLDVHVFHTQLPELTDFARAFPDTTIILNHYGVPLGVGPFAGKQAQVFPYWRAQLRELAKSPNIFVKLGGMKWADLPIPGYDFALRKTTPSSEELAKAWSPYVETCVEIFGPDRCMCESNFPPEKMMHSYVVLWNAFKLVTARYAQSERAWLFKDTAAKAYRLPQFIRPA